MRLAISTPVYPFPGDPSRAPYIFEIARQLGTLVDVEVFFHAVRYSRHKWLQPSTYQPVPVGMDLSSPNVKVTVFDYPTIPFVGRVFNGLLSERVLEPHLRRFAPDIVLGYWLYPEGYGAWRCARALNVPCVLGGLGTDIRGRDRLTRWLTGCALRGADHSIMVSEEMRQSAIVRFGVHPERVHTIPNGVNTGIFHPRPQRSARVQLGLPLDQRLIVYVGRFIAAKGMRELIAAFETLSARRPDVQLALIGDGMMREEIVQRLHDSQLTDRVHLPGALQPEQVARWLNAGDLLCLPSYSEGHPNVVVEALACGLPVVATSVGGIPESVNESNGRLVHPRDADALLGALEGALDADWDRAAISRGVSRGWDDVARETLAICEQALRRQSQMSGG